MTANARNILVVLILAAALAVLPGAGVAAGLLSTALSLALLAGLALFAARLYRQHRLDLDGLGEQRRALLYGALAVAVLTLTASSRLWATSAGTLAWFVLIGTASYAVFAVWRSTQRY